MVKRKEKIKELDWSMDVYEDLSLDDLNKIIYRYRKRLEDLKRLHQQKSVALNLEYTESDSYISTKIKILTRNNLNIMGYSCSDIYKKDCEIISDKLIDAYKWFKPHGPYSNELLSICIVSIVLEHYDVKFNLDDLLKIYNSSLSKYTILYRSCKNWCDKHYWKK